MAVVEMPPPARLDAERRQERLLERMWNGLVHPIIRLRTPFPWGLKDFSRMYAIAAIWYVVGSVVPLFLMFGGVMLAIQIWPDALLNRLVDAEGHANMQVIMSATVVSFFCGFGAELAYFNTQLKKQGLNLYKLLNLNLDSLNGSWFEAFKRSFCALVVALLIQEVLDRLPLVPHPHQATADMVSHAHGGSLIAFGVLAAVLAPFFEEVIFRGFMFNAFRRIFREGRIYSLVGSSQRRADYCAVAMSAFWFAMAHMDGTAFIQLFILGVILAELYRRSGSLVCPMLLHAMNNLIATVLIVAR
jgi:membrane protease YdiL (CAAX protease family)